MDELNKICLLLISLACRLAKTQNSLNSQNLMVSILSLLFWITTLQPYNSSRFHITVKNKENRIYIRVEFTRKKCKTAILLYCFHTAGVLHILILLDPGISFYWKSKIIVKRKPNYEIGWFHNWPMIISHRLYAFTLQTMIFRYNYKSNDVFIHLIHYKVYLTV